MAGADEDADNFMQIHKIEIAFHEAGSTKNSRLYDVAIHGRRDNHGWRKDLRRNAQIRGFWQGAGTFQPQNQWVAYSPAFRIKYDVQGDRAHFYFECLYVDKAANKIAAHTNSDDLLVRVNGRWLIKDMKAAAVPEL